MFLLNRFFDYYPSELLLIYIHVYYSKTLFRISYYHRQINHYFQKKNNLQFKRNKGCSHLKNTKFGLLPILIFKRHNKFEYPRKHGAHEI